MDELTYRDMIDLYLDSMLPSEQRSVLFSALASSEELQADFYHALMIRLAASHYVQQLVPPPAVTARILAATAPPASLLERIRQQLPTKTVRSTLATAAVLSIGFLIGRISTSDIIFPEAERNTTQQARTLPTTSSSPSTAAAPLLPAASPTRTYPASTLPQNRASGVSPVVQVTHEPNAKQVEPLHQHRVTVVLPELPQLPQERDLPPIVAPPSLPAHKYADRFDSFISEHSASKLVVGIRRTTTVLLRQQRLAQPVSSTPIDNTIVSVEHRNGNVGVFVQAGSEQFPIYEVSTKSDGTQALALHQQLWWIGGGLRAYLLPTDDNSVLRTIRPVAGIMLGTSAYGVLGRAELGLVWEPLPDVGVQWLIEGMVHSHGVGTNWEHAEKLSGSIGLVFRF